MTYELKQQKIQKQNLTGPCSGSRTQTQPRDKEQQNIRAITDMIKSIIIRDHMKQHIKRNKKQEDKEGLAQKPKRFHAK